MHIDYLFSSYTCFIMINMHHSSSLSKLYTTYYIHNHSFLIFHRIIRQDLFQFPGKLNSSTLDLDGSISLNAHTAKQVQDPSQIPDLKDENESGNDWSHYSHKKGVRKSMGTFQLFLPSNLFFMYVLFT